MDHTPELAQPDPAAIRLQRDIYYQVVHDLFTMLPEPRGETRAEYDRRFRVAIAHVASLAPVNADEADIAVHCVAASAHAKDCLHQAGDNVSHPLARMNAQKQAASMMRAARGQRSLLLRVQAARYKRTANDKTREQDEWSEHCALGWMTQALEERLPPPQAATPRPTAEPAPAPRPSPAPAPRPSPAPAAATQPPPQPPAARPQTRDAWRAPPRPVRDDSHPGDAAMLRLLENLPGDGGFDRRGAAFLAPVINGTRPRQRATG